MPGIINCWYHLEEEYMCHPSLSTPQQCVFNYKINHFIYQKGDVPKHNIIYPFFLRYNIKCFWGYF